MSNLSNLNYENIPNPFDSSMEREGGLLGAPGMVDLGGAGEYEKSTSKEIHGNDLDNLWLKSWIKSRNYKPKVSGLLIDGKRGYIECMELYVGQGGIIGGSLNIPDTTTANSAHIEADGDTYWGCNIADWASNNDNANAYVLKTGVAKFQNVTISGASSTIDGKDIGGFSTVVDDGATPVIPTGLSVTAGIQYNLLEWTANSETDMSHYEVWRNTTDNSGTASKIGDNKTTLMVDGGLTGEQAYYYWLKAVDHLGNTSGFNAVGGTTATPRNVTNSDVTQGIVAEKILIDGAVYLSNWRHGSDVTKINGGNIYAGSSITISSSGNIKSGQTAYETGTGWWIGDVAGTPKLSMGTATNYLKWTGTNIIWKGTNTELDASGNLIASSVTVSGALTTGAGSTINGGYVDSLDAGKITAGTMNAARINGGDINGVTITGVTIEGGTIRTGSSGQRVVITGSTISYYDSSNYKRLESFGGQGTQSYFNTSGALMGGIEGQTTGASGGGATYGVEHILKVGVSDAAVAIGIYNTKIQFFNHIMPKFTNQSDIGSATYKWRHLYLDQDLQMDAEQGIWWAGTYYWRYRTAGYIETNVECRLTTKLKIPVGTNLY